MKVVNDIVRLQKAIENLQSEVKDSQYQTVKTAKHNTLCTLKSRVRLLKRDLTVEQRNVLHFAQTFQVAV